MSKLEVMSNLVVASGGRLDGRFVKEHGILLLSNEGGVTSEALTLFDAVNISSNQPDDMRLFEFTARITYLSFPKTPNYDPALYHENIQSKGHISPYNLKTYAFLVTGLSIEMVLEIVSGKANNSGRLTSSDTIAMNETLYYSGDDENSAYIESCTNLFLKLRGTFDTAVPVGVRNQLNLSNKASAIVVSMERDEWLQLIEARLHPETNCELEYQLILRRISNILFGTVD